MARADGEAARQPLDAVAIDRALRNQPHRTTDEITAHIPFRRARRGVGPASLAGPEAGELCGSRGRIKLDVLALGAHRSRAARPAVDTGRLHGGDEPTIEPCVTALDGPVAALEIAAEGQHSVILRYAARVWLAEIGHSGQHPPSHDRDGLRARPLRIFPLLPAPGRDSAATGTGHLAGA
jgi:hypothetical protein